MALELPGMADTIKGTSSGSPAAIRGDLENSAAATTRRWMLRSGASGAALALATACGAGSSGGGADKAKSAPTQPFTLLWQIRDGATYQELVNWGISEYKKKYPNATINTTLDAGNVEKTVTLMAAGEGPDVIHGWGHVMWRYAAKGQLFNHNDLIRDFKKTDLDDFADYQWTGLVIPTTNFRFGLPTYINMMVLYYNKTLFQKRGQKEPNADWNHDDYAAMVKQMSYQDGAQQIWGGWLPATSFDRFQNHVLMYGGHVVDPKDLTKTQLDQPAAQQALEWIRARLHTDKSFGPLDSNKRPWGGSNARVAMQQGYLATIEDGMHAFQDQCKNMTAEWNIAHVPKGPTSAGGKRAVLGTTDSWGLWKGTKNKDAAWDLIKFITGKEWFDQQSKIEGLIPSRKSALQGYIDAMKAKWPAAQKIDFKVVTDALTVMKYPTVDEIFLCQNEVDPIISPALNAVLRDGDKPVTYFRDIKSQIEQAAGGCGIRPDQVYK